jgi:hypothetical protein
VIAGRGPAPRLVIALIRRLPDTSMTTALASGGAEHFGWGIDRHLSADLFDAVQQLTRAAGNWKGQPPKLPKWPRPKRGKKTKRPERATVKDLYAHLGG